MGFKRSVENSKAYKRAVIGNTIEYGQAYYNESAFGNYWERGIEKKLIASGIENPTEKQIKAEMTKSLVTLQNIYDMMSDDVDATIARKDEIKGPYADVFVDTFLNGEEYRLECLLHSLKDLQKEGLLKPNKNFDKRFFIDKYYDIGDLTTRRLNVKEKDYFWFRRDVVNSEYYRRVLLGAAIEYGQEGYNEFAFANYWKRGIEKKLIASGIEKPTKKQIKEEMLKSLPTLQNIYEMMSDDVDVTKARKKKIKGPYADVFVDTFLNGEEYRFECLLHGLKELQKEGLAEKEGSDKTTGKEVKNKNKTVASKEPKKKMKEKCIALTATSENSKTSILKLSSDGKMEVVECENYSKDEKILPGQLIEFLDDGKETKVVAKCDRPESQALRFDQLADALNQLLDIRDDIEDFDDLIVDVLNGLQLVAFENISIEKKVSPKHSPIFDKSYEFIDNIYKNLKKENLEEQIQEWIDLNKTIMESKQLAEKSEKQRIAEKNNFGKDGGMFKTDY